MGGGSDKWVEVGGGRGESSRGGARARSLLLRGGEETTTPVICQSDLALPFAVRQMHERKRGEEGVRERERRKKKEGRQCARLKESGKRVELMIDEREGNKKRRKEVRRGRLGTLN